MKTITLLHSLHENKVGEMPTKPTFFPRIIREFEDERDEPMIYGSN